MVNLLGVDTVALDRLQRSCDGRSHGMYPSCCYRRRDDRSATALPSVQQATVFGRKRGLVLADVPDRRDLSDARSNSVASIVGANHPGQRLPSIIMSNGFARVTRVRAEVLGCRMRAAAQAHALAAIFRASIQKL
jgi:hypothetical protein